MILRMSNFEGSLRPIEGKDVFNKNLTLKLKKEVTIIFETLRAFQWYQEHKNLSSSHKVMAK